MKKTYGNVYTVIPHYFTVHLLQVHDFAGF